MVDHSKFLMVADDAVDHLRYLIKHFPNLVTPEVKAAVEHWDKFKQWRGSVEFYKPAKQVVDQALLAQTAIDLLQEYQMDDVMEMLAEKFSIEMDYHQFIGLVGKTRYRHALRNESKELQKNSISFEQMADLWNNMGKPAMGGDRWTAQIISMLVE